MKSCQRVNDFIISRLHWETRMILFGRIVVGAKLAVMHNKVDRLMVLLDNKSYQISFRLIGCSACLFIFIDRPIFSLCKHLVRFYLIRRVYYICIKTIIDSSDSY